MNTLLLLPEAACFLHGVVGKEGSGVVYCFKSQRGLLDGVLW